MTDPTSTQIRFDLIQTDDKVLLPNDLVNHYLARAKSMVSSDDEVVLSYQTCYLLANNWDSIYGVESREGVKYRKPDPDKFLKLVQDRLKKIEDDSGTTEEFGIRKESADSRFCYDSNGNMQRRY